MDAAMWDERYRAAELVWGAAPNRWVEQEVGDLPTGRAIDLACGEGRNALWLAARGWQVTAVDFSAVALEKGRTLESRQPAGATPVDWQCHDATEVQVEPVYDLALLCYLQLPAPLRGRAVRNAAAALAPGGVLLVIAHDSANLTEGTGGPQDPAVLYTAADVVDDLGGALSVDRADAVLRPVDGAQRPAIDALLRAHRAAG